VRPLTLVAALALALALGPGLGAPIAQTVAPPASPDPARFEADIAAFEAEDRAAPPPSAAILFVGSSSIRGWDVAGAFPAHRTIRRGYGGSQVSDTIHFADRLVVRYHPALVVFYAGDADVAGGKAAAVIAGDTATFVALVHTRLPDTPVVVIGTKPSPAHWAHMATIRDANARVRAALSGDRLAAFVDVEAALLGPDGQPRPDFYTENRLNLNARGYEAWTAAIAPTIERLAPRRAP
jgi:lysophospholipase L1-like esterase